MSSAHLTNETRKRVVVVGAGIAGLSAAARLAHAGTDVIVIERHGGPGGKMRCISSLAGPVDAGPTVLTIRPVFEELFADIGERLEDHVELIRQPAIARHFWPDGSQLDLFDSDEKNFRSIRNFAGERAVAQFRAFNLRARRLFGAFDLPVMRSARPSRVEIARTVLRRPALLRQMAPSRSLAGLLDRSFSDPRLAQLFGRYATYVGGSPYRSPALLALIWQAEASGVWVVRGGMHRLALALEKCAEARGASFLYDTGIARFETKDGRIAGVVLENGERIGADCVVFNGDPRALAVGALGSTCAHLAPTARSAQRSLSADVWAFAARVTGPDLLHHNVFFRSDPEAEFAALERGERIDAPTLYVCAQDRGGDTAPPSLERFEIIANAPSLEHRAEAEGMAACRTRIFGTLESFGLRFQPEPHGSGLTTPTEFDRLFPHSAGSLYGQSPHGLMASFRRPTARTALPGLYLAGGGTHPGPGVPMAALSGRHAAEAILSDRTSTSSSRRTAMPGGTSTEYGPTAAVPSASSHS